MTKEIAEKYRDELIAGKQVAYEGHVLMVTDSWVVPSGKTVYIVFDNMSMEEYNLYA